MQMTYGGIKVEHELKADDFEELSQLSFGELYKKYLTGELSKRRMIIVATIGKAGETYGSLIATYMEFCDECDYEKLSKAKEPYLYFRQCVPMSNLENEDLEPLIKLWKKEVKDL